MDVEPSGLDFVDIIEVEGKLSAGTNPGVRCRLRILHDRTNRTAPTAQVYGTKKTYDGLFVLGHSARPYLTFKSVPSGPHGRRVFSDQVVLEQLKNPGAHAGRLGGHEIGSLCFDRLTLRQAVGRTTDDKKRHLCLLLQGPSSAWGVFGTQTTKSTGQIIIKNFNTTVRLGVRSPFSIRVSPHFFHANAKSGDQPIGLHFRGFAIHFDTAVPVSSLKNSEFLSQALDIADELLGIVSFLSKDRIAWYMYYFATGDSLLTEVRRVTYRVPRRVDFNELVINPPDLRKFLRFAFRHLKKLKDRNIDLALPMRLYVSSFEAHFIEDQFITAFRAVESLVSLVPSSSRNRKLLTSSRFEALKKEIASQIDARVPAEIAALIKDKLPELNRASFRRRLELMCEALEISLVLGLYPAGVAATLVTTRNKLVHRAQVDDIAFIHREIARVRALVERALLSLVGWGDVSRAPPRFVSTWLESVL